MNKSNQLMPHSGFVTRFLSGKGFVMNNVIKGVALLALLLSTSSYAQDTGVVNLVTSESGMHRISHAQLLAEGVDLSGLRLRKIALTRGDQKIPVRVTKPNQGRPNLFGPGSVIEFYADEVESLYTRQASYTLHYDRNLRKGFATQRNRFKAQQAVANQYQASQLLEENNYYDFLAPSQTDPWHYGQVFGTGSGDKDLTTVEFELEGLAGDTAEMDVEVFGILDIPGEGNDHHIIATVNNVEVGDQQFEGNTATTLSVSGVPVNAGTNTFVLGSRSIESTPFDALGLNQIMVRYPRYTQAVGNYLEGQFDGTQAMVEGFVNNAGDVANVYRKEANGDMVRITGTKRASNSVSFNTGGVAGHYIAVADNGYRAPTVAAIAEGSDLTSGPAEYLIITHSAFMGSELDALVEMRSVDYSVKVVDVAQVYAEYGDHQPSADAVHNYIKFAASNLQTRFVTLVGGDTYDYKNFTSESVSYIPTKYVTTPGGRLTLQQTPSDAAYGDLDGDGVQDLAIGRIAVRTNQAADGSVESRELADVIEKIRDYQAREGYIGRVLVAADREDLGQGVNFTNDLTSLIEAMPADWAGSLRDDFRALPDIDGDALARAKIIAGINAGVSVTSYIGHSSQQQWARGNPALFTGNEIASLNNIDKPTLVMQWGCYNTYFVTPDGNSMGQEFLTGGLNGAVAVLGASTLTTSEGERLLGIEINKRIYERGATLGEAVVQAKQALAQTNPGAVDILLGWQILGDPALKVNP